jgi:hypothetical protein
MPLDEQLAKEIHRVALEKPTPAERAEHIEKACGTDAALLVCVRALLHSHEVTQSTRSYAAQVASTVDETRDEIAATSNPARNDALRGTVIGGRYKILQALGAGGMGEVWLAEQAEPVRRTVAVKIIKTGAPSDQILARFEAERQALAMMDHPNIAKMLDAGETEGRPYFVMELVDGIPMTKFCDLDHLTPRQRLELFIPPSITSKR